MRFFPLERDSRSGGNACVWSFRRIERDEGFSERNCCHCVQSKAARNTIRVGPGLRRSDIAV
jgi:hypothetical protein